MMSFLAVIIIAIGILGILGNILGISWLLSFGVNPENTIKIPTATALTCLGLVLLCARKDRQGSLLCFYKESIFLAIAGTITLYYTAVSLYKANFDIFALLTTDFGITVPFLTILNLSLSCLAISLLVAKKRSEAAMAYGVGVPALILINLSAFAMIGYWANIPSLYDFRMSFPTATASLLIGIALLIGSLPYQGLLQPVVSRDWRIRLLAIGSFLLGLVILADGILDVQRFNELVTTIPGALNVAPVERMLFSYEVGTLLLSILVKTLSLRAIHFWERSSQLATQKIAGLDREATIRRMIAIVHGSLDLEDVFQKIVDEVGNLLKVNRAYIARYDHSSNHLAPPTREFRSSAAIPSMIGADHRISPEDGWLIEEMCRQDEPFPFDPDTPLLSPATKAYFKEIHLESGVGCAIKYRDECLAILFVHQTHQREWSQDERYVMHTAASQVAVAIHQSQLYHKVTLSQERQAALARFSHMALANTDLSNIFEQAVNLVADTLHVKFSKIVEQLPDAEHLTFRAVKGWNSELVGKTINPKDEPHAAYTLQVKQPVIVNDLEQETRFPISRMQEEYGIRSGASVIISQSGTAYGVLEADMDERRHYSRGEVEFLQTLANMLATVIERKRAEKEILESHERFRLVSRATKDIIWDWDLLTNKNYFNESVYTMFKYPPEAITDDIQWWYHHIHPEDKETVIRHIHEVIDEGGESWTQEYRFLCGDGDVKTVLDRGYVLRDTHGQPVRMIGSMIDITERKQFEEALIKNEARLRTIIDSNTLGIFFWDKHSAQITDANNAFLQMIGYTKEEMLSGKINWQELTPPEYWHLDNQCFKQLAQNEQGRCDPYEKQYITKDGRRIDILIGGAHYQGQADSGVAFVLDITERKQAAKALEESEVRFRRLVDANIIGILFWRIDGAVVDANDAFLNMLGYSREEMQAGLINWREITPEEYAPLDEQIARELQATGVGRPIEKQYIAKDGRRIDVLLGGACFDPECTHGVAFVLDISERKKTEKNLADIKFALDQSDIVAITDKQGTITYVNDAFCKISKFEREELLGQNHRIINSGYHPKEFFNDMWATIGHGEVWHGEVKNRAKDGSYYWVDTTIVPFLDEPGKPYQYIAIRHDITARKAFEKELAIAKEEAELANQRKSQALANMSHELRTPLNGVIGYSDMLLKGYATTPDKIKQYAANISNSGRHLLDMINDILDVAKVESGKVDLSPEHIEITPVVNELREIIRPIAEERNVELHFDTQPGLDGGEWDPTRFRQILLNLLSNAIKYNKEGGKVFVRLYKTEDRQWFVCEIEDTGIGIPKDKLGDIFSEFFRVNVATKEHQGTGLGLTVTKRLLELQGGYIFVTSEEGIGSTFTFRLPVTPLYSLKSP